MGGGGGGVVRKGLEGGRWVSDFISLSQWAAGFLDTRSCRPVSTGNGNLLRVPMGVCVRVRVSAFLSQTPNRTLGQMRSPACISFVPKLATQENERVKKKTAQANA